MMGAIYKRTSKGNEEIQNRTYKLDHFHRFVLIMVDGKADSDNIVSRSSQQWNPVQCLFELETKGFIVNIDSQARKASNIGNLKQSLISVVQKHLPRQNTKIINKILNSELRKTAILNAIDSSCIFVKLTISEEISNKLKIELHEIAKKSKEI